MIYRQPAFSIPETSKRSYTVLKERMKRIFQLIMFVFWPIIIVIVIVAMLALCWHADSVEEESERKDCQQYADIAQRDTPMRCMHYWNHHHNE